jgi:predicted ribosomally synthesized peptide with SipW-like signal peptide
MASISHTPRHAAAVSRTRGRVLTVLAVVLGILLSGAVVLTASRAAFSDTTSNSNNSFTTGTVDLIDDDSDSAAFTVTNMVPGQTVIRCILVTYQGTIVNTGPVRLYSGGFTDSGTLGSHLNLTVEEGSGGDFSTCTGFTASATIESATLTQFNIDHTNYTNGAGTWDPSGTPESRTYRITVQLSLSAPSVQQGQSITALIFTWETQS